MPIRFSPRRATLVAIAAALVLAADDAGAQLEFAGIPWGTAQDAVTERMRAAGYTYRGVDQEGGMVFGAADSVDVVATFSGTALAEVSLTWLRDPDRLPARFQRMADSMRTAVGAPDTVLIEEGEGLMLWRRGDAKLEMFLRPRSGGMDTVLIVRHEGPEMPAVYADRYEDPEEQERDTTAVGDYHQAFGGFRVLIRVDTVKYERTAPGTYRARFLHDWMQMRRLPDGMMYSSALSEVELDCRAFRTRTIRRTMLYERPAAVIDVPPSERTWTRPPPESSDGMALRSACEALGRQP